MKLARRASRSSSTSKPAHHALDAAPVRVAVHASPAVLQSPTARSPLRGFTHEHAISVQSMTSPVAAPMSKQQQVSIVSPDLAVSAPAAVVAFPARRVGPPLAATSRASRTVDTTASIRMWPEEGRPAASSTASMVSMGDLFSAYASLVSVEADAPSTLDVDAVVSFGSHVPSRQSWRGGSSAMAIASPSQDGQDD